MTTDRAARAGTSFSHCLPLVFLLGLAVTPATIAQARSASPALTNPALLRQGLRSALAPRTASALSRRVTTLSPRGRLALSTMLHSQPRTLSARGVQESAKKLLGEVRRFKSFAGHYFEQHFARYYGARGGPYRFTRPGSRHVDILGKRHRYQLSLGSKRSALEKALVSDRYASRVVTHRANAGEILRGRRMALRYHGTGIKSGRLKRIQKYLGTKIRKAGAVRYLERTFKGTKIRFGRIGSDGVFRVDQRTMQRLGLKIRGTSATQLRMWKNARKGLKELAAWGRRPFRAVSTISKSVGRVLGNVLAWVGLPVSLYFLGDRICGAFSEGGWVAIGDHALEIAVLGLDAAVSGVGVVLGAEVLMGPAGWIAAGITLAYYSISYLLNSIQDREYMRRRPRVMLQAHRERLLRELNNFQEGARR